MRRAIILTAAGVLLAAVAFAQVPAEGVRGMHRLPLELYLAGDPATGTWTCTTAGVCTEDTATFGPYVPGAGAAVAELPTGTVFALACDDGHTWSYESDVVTNDDYFTVRAVITPLTGSPLVAETYRACTSATIYRLGHGITASLQTLYDGLGDPSALSLSSTTVGAVALEVGGGAGASGATVTTAGAATFDSTLTAGLAAAQVAGHGTGGGNTTIRVDSDNTAVDALRLEDTHNPTSGQTGTSVCIPFYVPATTDGGTTYAPALAAKLCAVKSADYEEAGGTTYQQDSLLTLTTYTNGGAQTVTLSASSISGVVQLVSSAFVSTVSTSKSAVAGSITWHGDGWTDEGATADGYEHDVLTPAYVGTVDGDVTSYVAVGQGTVLTLQTGISPKSGTLSGQGLAQYAAQAFTVTYADLQAAGASKDLALVSVPARTLINYVICDTDTAGAYDGGAATLVLSVGDTGAGYDDWLVDWNGLSDLTVGDADGERGTDLPDADTMAAYLPSFTGATTVYMHAETDGAGGKTLANLAAGSWTCDVGFTVLP